jgi:multidrug resistance efflux pump
MRSSLFALAILVLALGPAAGRPEAKTAKLPSAGKAASGGAAPSAGSSAPAGKAGSAAKAAKETGAAGKPAASGPETATATKGLFKVEVSLKGVFEAQRYQEVILLPESWKTFEVLKAVAPGAAVKKGDVLIEFDAREIDETISETRSAQRIAELSLKQAKEGLRATEALTPLDLQSIEQGRRAAEEDLLRFLKIHRAVSAKSAEEMLKDAQESLRYAREELAQLEKMYKADHLTEETEEIVLKRQRDAVRRAEFHVELAKVSRDQSLDVTLPRETDSTKQAAARQEISAARAKVLLPLAAKLQTLEVEKTEQETARSAEKLKRLLADRQSMRLRAEADGLVYYGQCVRGKWSGAETAAKSLRRGGSVAPHDVVMTVVSPRPLGVRVEVPEKHLRLIRPGSEALVESPADADRWLAASVANVDKIPLGEAFDGQLVLRAAQVPELLVPGMSCKVKLLAYKKAGAISVPAGAVFREPSDEQQQYVYLVPRGGKPKKQGVVVGERTDDRAEIVRGLKPGDRVLLQRPEDENK